MTPPNEDGASINDDWWGLFHLRAFLSLTQADRNIERRELVWVKRFLAEAARAGRFDNLTRKPLRPTRSEERDNRRARSARLRLAVRLRDVDNVQQNTQAPGRTES